MKRMIDAILPFARQVCRFHLAVTLLVPALLALASPLWATDYVWTKAAGTYDWTNNANWTPSGYPSAAGDIAWITNVANGITVRLDLPVITLGDLEVRPADWNTHTITTNAVGQILVLDNGASRAKIWMQGTGGNTLVIQAPLQLNSGLVVTNSNWVKINGPITGPNTDIALQQGYFQLAPPVSCVYSGSLTSTGGGVFQKGGISTLTLVGTNVAALAGDWGGNAAVIGGGTLAISGGLFTNLNNTRGIIFGSAGNSLVVTNGGQLINKYTPGAYYTAATNTVLVTGDGSLWDITGSQIDEGNYGQNLVIANGGEVRSGGCNLGDGTSGNAVQVVGTDPITSKPALWNVGDRLNIGNGATSRSNSVTISAGGIITNTYIWMAGFDGSVGNGGSLNSLTISSGGKLFSGRGDGYGFGSCIGMSGISGGRVDQNTALVTGSSSLWDLQGATLSIGFVRQPGATGAWNAVRVESGALLTNASTLYVGRTYSTGVSSSNSLSVATGGRVRATSLNVGSASSTGNTVTVSGAGDLRVASLNVSTGNTFVAGIDATGLTPALVSGTATFSAGSYISATNLPGAPAGHYAALIAGSIVNNGLMLDPALDTNSWSFAIVGKTVMVTYVESGVPSVDNAFGATDVSATTANLNGDLISTGAAPTSVWVYWGTTNQTTSRSAWATNFFFDVQSPTSFSYAAPNLTPSTTYWYAYYASNSLGERFAQPSRPFTTLGLIPVVDDSAGASSLGGTNATLNGVLTDGTSARVYVCWGTDTNAWANTNDAGTVSQGIPFAVSVTNLNYSTRYYYRCFATNATGTAWAPTIPTFVTADAPPPTFTWTGAAGNSFWNTNGNWTPSTNYPNAPRVVAILTNAPNPGTVRLNQSSVTIGTLFLGVGDFTTVTVTTNAPGQTLILDNGGSPAQINQGHFWSDSTIAVPLQINNGLCVSNTPMQMNEAVKITGAISGPNADITIQAGMLQLAPTSDLVYSNRLTGMPAGVLQKGGAANLTLTGTNTVAMAGDWGGNAAIGGGGKLTISGGLFTNTISMGRAFLFNSPNNQLIVTNGGRLIQAAYGNTTFYMSGTNTVIVTGSGSLWDTHGDIITLDRTASRLIVANGGQVKSGSGLVGDYQFASACSAWVGGADVISGAPALWDVGGMLGIGNGTNSTGNTLTVDAGGLVTNAYVWEAGFDGNSGGGMRNSLSVTNGGRLFSGKGDGYGYGSCIGMLVGAYTGSVYRNSALVTGAGSLWSLEGASLSIGYINAPVATGAWNSVQVATGGILTNVGTLYVGRAANGGVSFSNDLTVATGGGVRANALFIGDTQASANALRLDGGAMAVSSLTVSPGNMLAPVVSSDGVVPLSVSGTATLAAGSYLSPTNHPDAAGGTYTVLTAGSVLDNGLALDPRADPSQWSFTVGTTNITLKYRPKGPGATIILVE